MKTLHENSLFQSWPDGLLALSPEGEIAAANRHAQHILGWSHEQLQGLNVHDSLCAETLGFQHELHDCPWQQPAFWEDNVKTEQRWKHKNGDVIAVITRPIILDNQQHYHLISFTEATHEGYNQLDLGRLAKLAENSPSPTAEFDDHGVMVFTNPAMIELMALTGFNDWGQPNILPDDFIGLVQECLQTGMPLTQVEHCFEGRWFSWQLHPQPPHNPMYVQVQGQETTSAKQLQLSLEREKQLAEAASEAKSHFLSIMSHELRTPLNAIIGFTRRLLTRADQDLPPRYADALRTILSNSNHLLGMINETLDLSKIEAGKMPVVISEFQIPELMREIGDLMRVLAEDKGLSLDILIQPEVPNLFHSDREFIRKVLINLAGNAIKFSAKGSISLVVASHENGHILFAVRDEGIGMNEDEQAKVFEKFTQASDSTSRRYGGTGLGLTLCKELVQLLNGSIGVESAPGQGSMFWFELPDARSL